MCTYDSILGICPKEMTKNEFHFNGKDCGGKKTREDFQ